MVTWCLSGYLHKVTGSVNLMNILREMLKDKAGSLPQPRLKSAEVGNSGNTGLVPVASFKQFSISLSSFVVARNPTGFGPSLSRIHILPL